MSMLKTLHFTISWRSRSLKLTSPANASSVSHLLNPSSRIWSSIIIRYLRRRLRGPPALLVKSQAAAVMAWASLNFRRFKLILVKIFSSHLSQLQVIMSLWSKNRMAKLKTFLHLKGLLCLQNRQTSLRKLSLLWIWSKNKSISISFSKKFL